MKSKGTVKNSGKDAKKEKIFSILSDILTDAGFTIRREELKRGYGWKAVSGACRMESSKILFVDRRMSQEDQLSFLSSKIVSFNITPTEERSKMLADLEWSLGTQEIENRV